ncbi:MAG: formate dehydrogenase accessory sulfurtransferase FdhD [Planctomycetes bacterium]|nr:formate dehydrogenase accessory sulfurtransferase FdhD [Planctomycetota bacterium]
MGEESAPNARLVRVTRLAAGPASMGGDAAPVEDWVAHEEPLEVRVAGAPLAVLLRTPGQDRELLAGFLAAEGIVRGPEDLVGIESCRDPQSNAPEPNIWNVALAQGVPFTPELRRLLPVGSTCGLCGARTIEELERELPTAIDHGVLELSADYFARADAALRDAQAMHRKTAGSHGAGLFSLSGEHLAFAEDVGRHNAVDKVLGAQLLAGTYPLERPTVLEVTGRVSFEIVQKAALGGVAVVVGAGAPTSLAVDAAHRTGVALFGLARPDRVNCYAGRVAWRDAGPRERQCES